MPWASGSSVFTSGFEELAAYLAQVTDRTAVSRLLGISWVTVGSIVERVVARRLDGARFAKLRRIGVDTGSVTVQQVPWASGSSVFTSGFEELAAYLAQVTDRTAVSRLLGISWVTVGASWTGCGAAAGRGSVRQAETNRRR